MPFDYISVGLLHIVQVIIRYIFMLFYLPRLPSAMRTIFIRF